MDEELKERFIHPPFWMLFGLPWPDADAEMAEAAMVLAPHCVRERDLSENAADILGFTRLYAREHPHRRMVFLTDVTRWLSRQDSGWPQVGVDFEGGLQELTRAPVLGMYVTVSWRAYMHLTNATLVSHTVHYLDGTSEVLTEEERERVRAALDDKIAVDWPDYIRSMLRMGRLTL